MNNRVGAVIEGLPITSIDLPANFPPESASLGGIDAILHIQLYTPHLFTSICSKTLQLFNLHTEYTTHHVVSRYLFKYLRHCQRYGEGRAPALPIQRVWYVWCVCVQDVCM